MLPGAREAPGEGSGGKGSPPDAAPHSQCASTPLLVLLSPVSERVKKAQVNSHVRKLVAAAASG